MNTTTPTAPAAAHTSEPWAFGKNSLEIYHPHSGYRLATMGEFAFPDIDPVANGLRAVACVNSFAGVVDPAAELARLREVEAGAAELRAACANALDSFGGLRPESYAEASRKEFDTLTAALASSAGRDLLADVERLRAALARIAENADSLKANGAASTLCAIAKAALASGGDK